MSAQYHDVVILNGRVMDPKSGSDARSNVGITRGTIRTITTVPLQGRITLDASGLIVSPGFIDLHVHFDPHGRDQAYFSMKTMDGVTTALDLEAGTGDIDSWYCLRESKALIHYGATVGNMGVRKRVMRDPSPSLFPTGDAANRPASDAELHEIRRKIEHGLERGALGVGLTIQYMPGATSEEIIEMFRAAAKFESPCYVHLRYPGINALQEVIDAAAETKAPLHVVHVNSMGLRHTPKFLEMIGEAQSRGLDITTECYPYTAAATGLESALFDEGWQEKLGIDYRDLEWPPTGERLTEKTFNAFRKKGGVVIVHVMSEDAIQLAVTNPLTMIASDTLLENGKGHPRSAGTFCRVLGRYVREKQALTWMEALRKMTSMPAQRLEGRIPAMKNKGCIRVGADADITVFDPDRVIDRATYQDPTMCSEGIRHVLVNGILVVKDGRIQGDLTPGTAIRAPIK